MVGDHPTQTTSLPGDDLKPAWRVACVAYRKVRQAGELDRPAWLAARAAIQTLRPDLDERAAQAAPAVQYASVFHTTWQWHLVGDPKYLDWARIQFLSAQTAYKISSAATHAMLGSTLDLGRSEALPGSPSTLPVGMWS